jgi:hypothetical protein
MRSTFNEIEAKTTPLFSPIRRNEKIYSTNSRQETALTSMGVERSSNRPVSRPYRTVMECFLED